MNSQHTCAKRKVIVSLLTVMISTASMNVVSAPQISSVTISDSSGDRPTITIQGSGFGEKKQAAPILFDQLDVTYENGKLNESFQSLEDGEKIPATSNNQSSIWAAVSSGAWGSFPPEVTTQHDPRHEQSKEHYLLLGHNSTIGNPVAYGGVSGWDTPVDNTQLYVSWWFKPKYSPQWYWRISPISMTGKFIEGETLDVGGIISAKFIGIDNEGQINLVFNEKPPITKELLGLTIRGQSSGAQTMFPTAHIDSSGFGYETPGSQKYIRIWEDPLGKEGIRFSWTQMHQTIGQTVNWSEAPLKGNEWNLLELELDSKKGFARLRVNSKTLTEFRFETSLDYQGKWSPTIALIGLNGKVGRLQQSFLDDIYFDNTLQRVFLGDSSSFESLNHSELQRPIAWSDSEIRFELTKGAIKNIDNSYVYVADETGSVNESGQPICSTCKLPPEKINLTIE
ncbi:MAG: IPT/TIG domain [Marinobacter excellens HL-55]|uniref:IPT/TIG domain n=1 Tax=Marinobacter excellens HL-55 TaxID=1305731 RepID=A0A0P7YK20_9GAMM|nr:MAG: IPT/TIG domain [Marinobacter excellens HL-55]